MAAIVQAPLVRPSTPSRPALRLIEGGQSPGSQRVYRRRRVVAAIVGLVLVAGATFGLLQVGGALASAWSPGNTAVPAVAGHVVVVQPGDTLWSIAARAHPGGDLRPLVDRLQAAHGAGPLQPGERITVTP